MRFFGSPYKLIGRLTENRGRRFGEYYGRAIGLDLRDISFYMKEGKTRMRVLLVLIISVLLAPTTSASEPTYLYKTKLVQAAPGKLLEVIDLLKASQAGSRDAGDERPLLIRHSQGDHWDLLVLIPMKSYADYYSAERIAKRIQTLRDIQARLDELITWQEDVFVYGPPLADLRKALD